MEDSLSPAVTGASEDTVIKHSMLNTICIDIGPKIASDAPVHTYDLACVHFPFFSLYPYTCGV